MNSYIPNFLTIKAWQIEDWADSRIDARNHLPVLLRKLIYSTCNDLRQVDFPGYDNAQRKGSDGFVQAGVATPWTPEGNSYWEFGTDQRPAAKAEGDYAARLISVDPVVRAESTFVFVTPRNWPAKTEWEKRMNEIGDWKAVRALDASDLEQWLDQSVPAQIWLSEHLNLTVSGYETLEQAWSRWSNASEPRLTPDIFASSIVEYRDKFKDWLNKPSSKSFVIVADSHDEALAFLACLFDDMELCQFKDLTAVFTSPNVLRSLVTSLVQFIPIVYSEDVERELIDAHRRLHCIIYRPRNAFTVDNEVDIKLDLLSHESFNTALTSMGIEKGEIDRFARESGRSRTILRRRLSQNSAIRLPIWASDDRARALVPMVLIGAWHVASDADRKIVSDVANRNYEMIEEDITGLLRLDDSPVWSVGQYRGVASKIDALFATASFVTQVDLDRFFAAAEYVLSETDPALELPENHRWAAALYDKSRNHSSELRTGICETLVILSVHGNNLFLSRLGIDFESRVTLLIRKLLTPFSIEKLLSHGRDLPYYAEAAPDEFLKIIEDDLQKDTPKVFDLLKPVDSSRFGGPSRSGLLWALECISWKPKNLARVSVILANLSQFEIVDNWANKPIASLQAIFRSWMPQTAASLEQRIKVLDMIAKRFPVIGWEICIEQIKPGSRIGDYSYRPNWRGDASGAGQVVLRKEMYDFNRKALELLVAWPSHNEKTLGDLVKCLQGMPEENQIHIWDLIDEWSKKASESSRAELREVIRQFALSRRSRHNKLGKGIRDRAREAYDYLQPQDFVTRHGWLFANHWVEESIDELEEEDYDYLESEARVDKLRYDAMIEIWAGRGFEGIKQLIENSDAASVIGRYTALCLQCEKYRVDFIRQCLLIDEGIRNKFEWCLQGFLSSVEDDTRAELLQAAAEELCSEERIRLFACAPFQESSWRLLNNYGKGIRTEYWKSVFPSLGRYAPTELTELIECLLEAKRPRAAFYVARMQFIDIETSILKRLLHDVVSVENEPADHYKLDSYHISKALDALDRRPDVTRYEMAQLEFLFIEVLDDSDHGIPNLERQLAESPVLFVQAVALAYKRRGEGEDPEEWKIEDPERRAAVASAAHCFLDQVEKIPGTDENGRIDTTVLTEWLTEVRRLLSECARAEVGDQCLGQLLAKAPEGDNGIWPCEEVCEAMERIASSEIGKGFCIGVYNSRGAHWRDVGGKQERELAAKYHAMAEQVNFEYPYVGGVLEDIAEFYERDAIRNDSEDEISKRLGN
ncbi:hypothetical protein [Paenibacillus marinisediminis]